MQAVRVRAAQGGSGAGLAIDGGPEAGNGEGDDTGLGMPVRGAASEPAVQAPSTSITARKTRMPGLYDGSTALAHARLSPMPIAAELERLLIVPRWSGHAQSDYYPWLRERVRALGFAGELDTVELVPPSAPDVAATVAAVRERLGAATEAARTLVLGHSVGAAAVLRAVAELPEGTSVGAMVLVAGWWTIDEPWPTIVPWIETPFAWERARASARRRVVLLSDDDPYTADAVLGRKRFEERIEADVRIHEGAKHFNAEQEPAVLEAVQALLGLA